MDEDEDERGTDELRDENARLRGRIESDAGEIRALEDAAQLDRETIDELRADARRDRASIRRLTDDVDESQRIAAAQRALIRSLRSDLGVDAAEVARIGTLLASAERELVDLRAVRDALTPPVPETRAGVTVAARFTPAEPHVSGDFYVVTDGPDDTIAIAVGDVIGKGLEAARRAAFTRAAIASVASFTDDPCQLLELVNVAIVQRTGMSDEFVTAGCVTYKPSTRVLRWAYAGHPPALRLRTGGTLASKKIGLPLGIADEVECSPSKMTLEPGEGFVLVTDGLLEAGHVPDVYGADRAAAVIRDNPDAEPAELVSLLSESAARHADGTIRDDLCVVAVRAD